jgi:hypothetical protein
MLSLWLSGQLSCYLFGYPGSYLAESSVLGSAIRLFILEAIVLSHWLSGQLSCYLFGYPGSYHADPSMLGFDAITLAIRAAIVLSL